jgi:hypothetical protein
MSHALRTVSLGRAPIIVPAEWFGGAGAAAIGLAIVGSAGVALDRAPAIVGPP